MSTALQGGAPDAAMTQPGGAAVGESGVPVVVPPQDTPLVAPSEPVPTGDSNAGDKVTNDGSGKKKRHQADSNGAPNAGPNAGENAAQNETPTKSPTDAEDDTNDELGAVGTSGEAFLDAGAAQGVSFRLLMQARYADEHTVAQERGSPETADLDIDNATEGDGYRMNRLFLRAIVKPRKWIQGRMLIDFAELRWGSRRGAVKLAYVALKPIARTHVTVGFFKRPFSLLELLPIAEYEFADLGPTDEVIKELGFGGRDMGTMVQVEPLDKKRWLSLSLGVFAGDTEGRYASPGGLVAGRVESRPVRPLRLAVDAAWRPMRTKTADVLATAQGATYDYLDRGAAFSADATLTVNHFELRAEGLYGKRVDIRSRFNDGLIHFGDCPTGLCHWIAGWGLVSYGIPFGKRSLLMPALRAEWLDLNREERVGRRTFVTGAVNLDFTPELRLLADVTWRHVQRASFTVNGLNESIGTPVYDLSGTRLTVQLQLKI